MKHYYSPLPPISAPTTLWHDEVRSAEPHMVLDNRHEVAPPMKSSKRKGKKKARSHESDMYVCTEDNCGKTFPRSFALRRHMRIHTGDKPYVCDIEGCQQRFNTSGNLSRHKRIHSGVKPYPCIFETCGKKFNTSTKLKRHMRTHFPDGLQLFRCVGLNCSSTFDNYKEFAQHQKIHHNVIIGAGHVAEKVMKSSKDKDRQVSTEVEPSAILPYVKPEKRRSGDWNIATSLTSLQQKDKMDGNYEWKRGRAMPASPVRLMGHSAFPLGDPTPSFQTRVTSEPLNAHVYPTQDYHSYRSNTPYYQDYYVHSREETHQDFQESQCYNSYSILRPPPCDESKYVGSMPMPPTMQQAGPDFTGEELSVVLELMKDSSASY